MKQIQSNKKAEQFQSVLSNQNDTKLETDELASDLISAIKEFEETTAKITLTHQSHETHRSNLEEMQTSVSRVEEKGPVDYFNRTKESLRHVPQVHDTNKTEQKLHASDEGDESELGESYVKIPVQQLINTFEKQMRSIIKQKVNENIQMNMDGTVSSSSNNNKISTTYLNKDHHNGFAGKGNEMHASKQYSTVTSRRNTSVEAFQQQQLFDQTEQEVSNSIDEQYQWSTQSQSTTSSTVHQLYEEKSIESSANRFNSNENQQQDENIDGGKA